MDSLAWFVVVVLLVALSILLWRHRQRLRALTEVERQLIGVREQQRQAEEALRGANRQLQAVAQVGEQGIFLLDHHRQILWMNDSARKMAIPEADVGMAFSRIATSYEVLELVEGAVRNTQINERQFMRDGSTYHAQAVQIELTPLLLAVTIRDVTELQRLGRARREFVANISHDLRTPIAAIQLMVETLMVSSSLGEKRRQQLLKSISDQTSTLQQLAQELLDLSMIESGKLPLRLVPTQVRDLIEPVVTRMSDQAHRKNLHVHSAYDPELTALADPDNIRRVLQNLIHNAIKFTPDQGEITIKAERLGEDICFSISDTGPGIPRIEVDRVFERFFKGDRMRSEGGTGLGLSIARHIVNGHGGKIWAESEPERGSVFYFTLPLA